MPIDGNIDLLKRAYKPFIFAIAFYGVVVALLLTPSFQRHLIYLHSIRVPAWANYDLPERYGLAPGKTLNLNLTTSDGLRLGAWFVAADGFYQKHIKPLPPTKATQDELKHNKLNASPKHPSHYNPRDKLTSSLSIALHTHPTILYFHGNSMTRAFHLRTRLYSTLTSRLNANVLVIDYRGFGDSEGIPSEHGLLLDARAAWDWLIRHGAQPGMITVLGESLGTGVSIGLVARLANERTSPRGVALLAPYSSIPRLLETYSLGGRFPMLRPVQTIRPLFSERMAPIHRYAYPSLRPPNGVLVDMLIKSLKHKFDSLSLINSISCQITIVHAADDWHIPISHARALFDSLLEPFLPTQPLDPKDPAFIGARNTAREDLLAVKEVEGLGTIRYFERGKDQGSVVMLETTWGGHNWIREIEGVVDAIGWSMGE